MGPAGGHLGNRGGSVPLRRPSGSESIPGPLRQVQPGRPRLALRQRHGLGDERRLRRRRRVLRDRPAAVPVPPGGNLPPGLLLRPSRRRGKRHRAVPRVHHALRARLGRAARPQGQRHPRQRPAQPGRAVRGRRQVRRRPPLLGANPPGQSQSRPGATVPQGRAGFQDHDVRRGRAEARRPPQRPAGHSHHRLRAVGAGPELPEEDEHQHPRRPAARDGAGASQLQELRGDLAGRDQEHVEHQGAAPGTVAGGAAVRPVGADGGRRLGRQRASRRWASWPARPRRSCWPAATSVRPRSTKSASGWASTD